MQTRLLAKCLEIDSTDCTKNKIKGARYERQYHTLIKSNKNQYFVPRTFELDLYKMSNRLGRNPYYD